MRCVRLLRLVLAPLIVAMVAGSFLASASSVRADDTISIASWNIRNVSDKSRSDAELGIISLVLFRYDFIACLSGYHPHPLYVVCLLGLQARVGAGALRRRSG